MKHDWLRVSGVGTTWWLIVLFSLLGLHLKIRLHFTHQFGFLVGLRHFYLLPGKIGNSGNSEPVFPGPSRELGSSRWSHGLIARKLFLPLRLYGLLPLWTGHTAITREGLWGAQGWAERLLGWEERMWTVSWASTPHWPHSRAALSIWEGFEESIPALPSSPMIWFSAAFGKGPFGTIFHLTHLRLS